MRTWQQTGAFLSLKWRPSFRAPQRCSAQGCGGDPMADFPFYHGWGEVLARGAASVSVEVGL
eukprot:15198019-Alexandrium_andersonii.AAC.1